MIKFAHIGQEVSQPHLSILEPLLRPANPIKRILRSLFLVYKRDKVRSELKQIPLSTRIDIGLSNQEIDRVVESIK